MKLETIVNAALWAGYVHVSNGPHYEKRTRQYRAFRARILFMFENREIQIELYRQRVRQLDAEIESLENELVGWHEHCYGDENED